MTDDPRVIELLEELLDQGGAPEEVCRTRPELLPQVRARWQRLRALRFEISEMFGNSFASDDGMPAPLPTTDLPPIPGYEVQCVLGHGGMGVVYQARHLRLNRPVAVKMLLAGPYARPQELERFLQEAETVAGLRHANIVQVYDVGEVDGRPYFTMEYVEGGSLAQKLTGTPQPSGHAAAIVAILAEAMGVAHQSGIVHRDLKPGNILLTSDGSPKITDFGLARLEGGGGLTLTGAALGTPSYMAPEQARGEKGAIGPAVDVYALGVILYECLTGRPPFHAETATATIQQVVADEPVPPARLNPRLPRDLETICLKCLEKSPARRYVSAAALADDLRRFERGEPIAARPAGWLERAAKWSRRRPAAAVLLAAGVLIFAGVTTATLWYADHQVRLRSEEHTRAERVNGEANAALDQAEIHLKRLRTRLDDPLEVRELLSDIDQWQRLVDQPRQDWKRAQSVTVANGALVVEETLDRLEAVEAALAREQDAYMLAKEVDDILVETFASHDTTRSRLRTAVAEYERLFSRQGLDVHQPNTARLASAITSSPARFSLIAALDNWALITGLNNLHERLQFVARHGVTDNSALLVDFIKDPLVARVLELARAADPDPWRDRFRHPAVWADRDALTRLAEEVNVSRQSPTVLVCLGWSLKLNGADATALFQRALLEHPRDFWLHLFAAHFISEPGVRIGLGHAALAIRPRNALAYRLVADSLRNRGDWPAVLVAANPTIEIHPNDRTAYHLGGLVLRDKKDLTGTVAALQRAIDLDPGEPEAQHDLGQVLRRLRDLGLRVTKSVETDEDGQL